MQNQLKQKRECQTFVTTHSNPPKQHPPKQNPSPGESHGSVGSAATAPGPGEEQSGGTEPTKVRERTTQGTSWGRRNMKCILILGPKATPLEDCLNTTLPRKRGQECGLSLRTNHPLIPKYKCDPDGTK